MIIIIHLAYLWTISSFNEYKYVDEEDEPETWELYKIGRVQIMCLSIALSFKQC